MDPLRVYVTPFFGGRGARYECDWLLGEFQRSGTRRYMLASTPERADLIVLTDSGPISSHIKFDSGTLSLLFHPLARRYRERCVLYYDHDVPRPYLPGLYTDIEWFPDADRFATAVPHFRRLEKGNPYLNPAVEGEKRDLLFSFMGRDSHPIRKRIFALNCQRDDVLIRDTSQTYDHFSGQRDPARQREYAEVMRRSRWALCPRGWSVGSLRLYEAMKVGVAPVILSDRWLPPAGFGWERFSLWVPEDRIEDLPEILEAHGDRWREMGAEARVAHVETFTDGRPFEYLMGRVAEIVEGRKRTSVLRTLAANVAELAAHWNDHPSPALRRARELEIPLPPRWGSPETIEDGPKVHRRSTPNGKPQASGGESP